MGGYLAWRYAASRHGRVTAGILVNSAGAPRAAKTDHPRSGGFRTIDLVSMPVINQLMVRLTPRFLIRDSLHQVYADPSKVTDELIERHHQMLLREGNRRAMVDAVTQRSAPTGPTPRLGDITQPMLVMWGRQDAWIPVADADVFHAALPNSELVIYDDAGHVPMEEIPRRSALDALKFLERHHPATWDKVPSEATSGDHAVARQEY